MESIRIKGLKCLYDTGDFELKKLNILVGINSSGKSTFLRTFPLLRQSVERKTRGPILWSGHYIDFGNFETSIYNNKNKSNQENETENESYPTSKNNNIQFKFSINYKQPFYKREVPLSFTISVKNPKNGQNSFTHRYTCELNGKEFVFEFDENGAITDISSDILSWDLKKSDFKFQVTDTDTLLPLLRSETSFFTEQRSKQLLVTLRNQGKNYIKSIAGSTSDHKSNDLFSKLTRYLYSPEEKLKIIKSAAMTIKWSRHTESWEYDHEDFEIISGIVDLYCIIDQSPKFNNAITEEFLGVRYIAPLRTSTQRYYRYQDINIDELDHQGENMGMFISNISKGWKEKLDDWTSSEFGFTVADENLAGHTSINIKHNNTSNSDNMSDMGFGYSQFLPIIIQLWSISSGYENSKKRRTTKNYILAIEQPELHLHPKLQAELTSVFIKSIKLADENFISVKIILETHSEAVISKTSQMIISQQISNIDVGIHCFEQNIAQRKTKIRKAEFTEKGTLKNWPFGFFEYI